MKAKIIYITVFLAAFLFTTGGIIYFNSVYKDIFKFDFTPIHSIPNKDKMIDTAKVSVADIKNYLFNDFKHEVLDSLKTIIPSKTNDTVYTSAYRDSLLLDSLKSLQAALKSADRKITSNADVSGKTDQKTQASNEITKPDSSYNVWKIQTAKLYESMDPQKAAKIIQSYSDNVARDIIYSMRQKKAADILSELNPETANRITRAK